MAKTETAPTASASPTPAPVTPGAFVPKVIKQVTLPLWKLRAGGELFVKITEKMQIAKALKNQTAEDKAKEPPTLINAVKLDTGEVGQFIAGSVLRDIFNDEYPNNSYVGKGFWIKVEAQKDSKAGGGRRYNNYTVAEIAT